MAAQASDLTKAQDPKQTPFDYIVVGSGAGGGPLAARLALSGKRVLVLEAGLDPALETPAPGDPAAHPDAFNPDRFRPVSQVPAYHGPATEDEAISWQFSVRHYENPGAQQADSKYDRDRDPSVKKEGRGQGGIQYPRTAALGGCTAHHAMIVVKPNDSDWNAIARRTGDPQWSAAVMQGYFARIEKCLYYTSFSGYFRKILGIVYELARRGLGLINPRYQYDWGGHGFTGWQTTSFIDPVVIAGIAWGDRTFFGLLRRVILHLLREKGAFSILKQSIARLQIVQYFDPNFAGARGAHGQLAFIPIGTDGKRRTGVREHLLATARAHPDRLVLLTGVLAKRVIFEKKGPDKPPQAIGVEVVEAPDLYEASPRHRPVRPDDREAQYFAKGEVILAGGAFNTPQLLMLSGIGEKAHLEAHQIPGPRGRKATDPPVADIVDLKGVGENLQDRYEVSVISQTHAPFTTLDGVTFKPGDASDPALAEWNATGGGLYSTNGGALAVFAKSMKRQQDSRSDPDLFIFGVPAAFRGYYWGWSRELLKATKGARDEQRDLWSWVILKAYTRNDKGTVRLRSSSPFEQPEICFRSFAEGPEEHVEDLRALKDGVVFVRKMNARVGFKEEIQPGPAIADESEDLLKWIQNEAWGHHACGTCRMGSDRWQSDVSRLTDKEAVLDSRFRVHGVQGLRVVDASVFPQIPGYFIVTPVFMIAEKAADVLLKDSEQYPHELEAAETATIQERRRRAGRDVAGLPEATLPADTVGLALSGGGIRSATFCLGLLQALAARNRLRDVDLLSTVSGGGYIASFLGRVFTRVHERVADKVGLVQEKLTSSSAEMSWLRKHANYLSGEGRADVMTNLAGVWRNLLGVHLFIGILFLAGFTGLRWVSGGSDLAPLAVLGQTVWLAVSPWWWLPLAVLLGAVVPLWCGFWIAPWPGKARPPILPLLAWITLVAGAVAGLRIPGASTVAMLAVVVLLLSWLVQEMAQWRPRPGTPAQMLGLIARNRLQRGQAISLVLLAVATAWFVLDTAARTAAQRNMMPPAAAVMGGLAMVLPFLRSVATKLTTKGGEDDVRATLFKVVWGAFAIALAGFLLFTVDVIAHAAFGFNPTVGTWVFWVTLLVSLALGRAIGFANLASLQPIYRSRLVRTFLGASNEARIGGGAELTTVEVADADDDLYFRDYHPETNGGPLHLINVTVNETVDAASGRPLREDKGLPMCVGPCGISVGLRYHSLWGSRVGKTADERGRVKEGTNPERDVLRPIRVASDPQSFHVLAVSPHKDPAAHRPPEKDASPKAPASSVEVEALRLGEWMAISGAALSTGAGRLTSLPLSLLLGLLNARLGYWWNTCLNPGDRPGRYPPTLLRRIRGIPGFFFRAQSIILNEWRSYFGGPAQRLWNLSDGGHFENTGLYELLRRRPAFMIAVDATEDSSYRHDSTALLVRRARQDFGAHFSWVDPSGSSGPATWPVIEKTLQFPPPPWIKAWINPGALAPVWKIQRNGEFTAALARVTYEDDAATASWLLLVKAGMMKDLPLDVVRYSLSHPTFPNQSTLDQFLDDDQWEAYRQLGECAGRAVLA